MQPIPTHRQTPSATQETLENTKEHSVSFSRMPSVESCCKKPSDLSRTGVHSIAYTVVSPVDPARFVPHAENAARWDPTCFATITRVIACLSLHCFSSPRVLSGSSPLPRSISHGQSKTWSNNSAKSVMGQDLGPIKNVFHRASPMPRARCSVACSYTANDNTNLCGTIASAPVTCMSTSHTTGTVCYDGQTINKVCSDLDHTEDLQPPDEASPCVWAKAAILGKYESFLGWKNLS